MNVVRLTFAIACRFYVARIKQQCRKHSGPGFIQHPLTTNPWRKHPLLGTEVIFL